MSIHCVSHALLTSSAETREVLKTTHRETASIFLLWDITIILCKTNSKHEQNLHVVTVHYDVVLIAFTNRWNELKSGM